MPVASRLHDRVKAFFAPGGALSRAHAAAEERPAQVEMALAVLSALQDGEHLVVEAGTGIGKTMAYLVPAILLKRRVIVSTGTKALQDQLALKDLPFLREACGLKFTHSVLKGRDNYLCKIRWDAFRRQPVFAEASEAAMWPRIEAWARSTQLGEMGELADLPESPPFWRHVNASNASCLGQRCPEHGECHLQEVRRAAQESDIVVVNHHLLLADAVVRESQFGAVLPDCDHVIFDEAHKLESAATSFFGRSISNWRLRELGDDTLRELQREGSVPRTVIARAERLSALSQNFGRAWGSEEGRWAMPARLPESQAQALADVEATARGLREALDALPGAPAAADPLRRRCEELVEDARLLARHEDPSFVHWFEVRGRGASVTATPVDVSEILRDRVFRRLHSSVLCSATLAVSGSLAHARRRLGLDEPAAPKVAAPAPARSSRHEEVEIDIHADAFDEEDWAEPPLVVREAILPSPFSYETQALLYLPQRMPEPRASDFVLAVAEECRLLLEASGGRAFLLFTSFENLRKTHEILRHSLAFPLHVQGEAPKRELLRRFRAAPGSVLFATSSFWEGIDVPGEALSLVVIDKLPFAVPSDPIVAARSRLIEERGGDSFRDLAIPEAILALKQGAGRLIRSAADRGVVALLDPRVRTGWGRAFLRDLPPFRQVSRIEDVRAFYGA